MKRISLQFSALLTALFLFAFSCQDHVVPEEPETETLKINTLNIESPTEGEYNIGRYWVEIKALGSKPIKEFGIVASFHSKGSNDYTDLPTIANQVKIIEETATLGEHSLIDLAPNRDEITEMFYRAYAELTNGDIIYGEVLKYIPADIASIQLTDVSGKTAPISATIDVSHLGTVDIEEYGLVYAYKINANDPLRPLPTLNDNKVKSAAPIKLGKQTIVLPIPVNAVNDIHVRPYVKFKNGNVYYGNIAG
jgi:hypothetical protein